MGTATWLMSEFCSARLIPHLPSLFCNYYMLFFSRSRRPQHAPNMLAGRHSSESSLRTTIPKISAQKPHQAIVSPSGAHQRLGVPGGKGAGTHLLCAPSHKDGGMGQRGNAVPATGGPPVVRTVDTTRASGVPRYVCGVIVCGTSMGYRNRKAGVSRGRHQGCRR